uniref:Uncharacterized protein n=1 Tax=Arundo donax TaxID=35708 RepID=A0A0A8XS04_ARUDO
MAHTIWGRISVDRLFWFPQPDLPVSAFVPCLHSLLKLRPIHGLVHKDATKQCHVWPYGLQVLIAPVSQQCIVHISR